MAIPLSPKGESFLAIKRMNTVAKVIFWFASFFFFISTIIYIFTGKDYYEGAFHSGLLSLLLFRTFVLENKFTK